MRRTTPFTQFSIERGVTNDDRDEELSFVRKLAGFARGVGVDLQASLGMSAVELVRTGEMRDITLEHGDLTFDRVNPAIGKLARRNFAKLGNQPGEPVRPHLGEARLYTPIHEHEWIGLPILPRRDGKTLYDNRDRIGLVLSDIAEEEIVLPPKELFLNVAKLDAYTSDGLDAVLEFVSELRPPYVELYGTSVRESTVYRPSS